MSAYRDRVIADGARHYWPLNERSGVVAKDIVNGLTGQIGGGVTLGGAGALANDPDPAMVFDGVSGRIDTYQPTILAPPFTVEWWSKTATNSHALPVFSTPWAPPIAYLFNVNLGQPMCHLMHGGGVSATSLVATASAPLFDDQWHHCVWVFAGGLNVSAYVDGAAVPVAPPLPEVLGAITVPVQIGYTTAWGPAYSWPGTLDEIVHYPFALTPQQIANHYALAQPPPIVPANTTAIHQAVLTYLSADATLKTLLPDGIWRGPAKSGKRFGVVDVFEGHDSSVFGGRAIETVLYAIKASVLDGAGGNVSEAFTRIDTLMSEARLTVPGYVFMSCVREDDHPLIDYEERNTTDSSLLWRHMGGHYRVSVSVPRSRRE